MKNYLTVIIIIAYTLGLLLWGSCTKKDDVKHSLIKPDDNDGQVAEQAFIDRKGIEKEAYYNGELIKYARIDDYNVFQGDILIPDSLLSTNPNNPYGTGIVHVPGKDELWAWGIIWFTIAHDLSYSKWELIRKAMDHWEAATKIRFAYGGTPEEISTGYRDHLMFVNSNGCASYLGKMGGRQEVFIGDDCSVGNIIHELGHAIGLYHEHSRADRDNYITIHWDNIWDGMDYNFETYTSGSGFQLGALDFGSIMMYGPYSFSKNGQPTITKSDGSPYKYQRDILSKDDIAAVRLMYLGLYN